jgi:hypothetical protein
MKNISNAIVNSLLFYFPDNDDQFTIILDFFFFLPLKDWKLGDHIHDQ